MPNTPSPLRYPGGKVKIYEFVKSIIEVNGLKGQTYIEPFAGGAGLALKLLLEGDVKRIVLNDFDPAIYKFWYSVLHTPDEMIEYVRSVELSVNEWDRRRIIYNNQDDYEYEDVAKSVLFLNRTNVSGVITGGIIGGRGQEGKYKMDARFNRDKLVKKIGDIAKNAPRIDLYNLDAMDFINSELRHYYKVLINFDPPYVNKGGQLYKNAFSEDDHRALRDRIADCRRKWIVTYDICDLVSELYQDYRSGTVDVYYSAKEIRKAKEYVFYSNNLVLP